MKSTTINPIETNTNLKLITVGELSELWGVQKSTLYNMLRREEDPLPHYRLGSVLIRIAEAEEWLARQRKGMA